MSYLRTVTLSHVSKDGKANSKIRTDKSLLVMTHKLKLSKHVHSFIHLLRANLFTELRQNSSVQNAFLKRNASKAFHIYTGRNYRETNKSQ